jgi:serine/threonine protein kinase
MEPGGLFANRYWIRRLIGKGGMAAVYDVTDDTTGEMRRTETAFDYGVDNDTPYYTMELLSGENLRNLAPLPWREAASLVRRRGFSPKASSSNLSMRGRTYFRSAPSRIFY